MFHVEHFSTTIIREPCPSNPSISFDSIIRAFRRVSWVESGISSGPFFNIIFPPVFKKGRPMVRQVTKEPKPRKRTRSNFPEKVSWQKKFSARPSTISIESNYKQRTTSRKKLHRFLWLSIRVKSKTGWIILIGIPGNPAPLPISRVL